VAWGDNSDGQCDTPPGVTNAVAIVGGGAHTVMLKADSTVAAWGNDWNGQCDLSPSTSNVVAVAAGYAHTLLLEANRAIGPQLVRAARAHGQFSLSLQTFAGKNYALEYKTNLTTGVWAPAATLRGSGGLQFLTDPLATNRARVYRVREYGGAQATVNTCNQGR